MAIFPKEEGENLKLYLQRGASSSTFLGFALGVASGMAYLSGLVVYTVFCLTCHKNNRRLGGDVHVFQGLSLQHSTAAGLSSPLPVSRPRPCQQGWSVQTYRIWPC